MLKLYTWKTPNGYKVPMLLEELRIAYEIHPIDISKGAQKTPEFLAMNPNHKIPVLVEEEAEGGPITIFESGAILMYLAERHGKFLPQDTRGKYLAIEWLMFQMASIGPMFGQANYFLKYAPEQMPFAIKRYTDEAKRLMKVLETRLAGNSGAAYLAGEYSIADIAMWPWIKTGLDTGFISFDELPSVKRWYEAIEGRPATKKAIENTDAAAKDAPAVCVPKFD